MAQRLPWLVVFIILCLFGSFNMYTMRINLSVSMVMMIKRGNVTSDGGGMKFDWSNSLMGIILGSFYYGYFVTQILGGILSQKYGGKLLLQLGVFFTSLFTLLTPVATTYGGAHALIAVRVVQGVCQGVTIPALYTMFAHWAPPWIRTKVVMTIPFGAQLGAVVSMAATGILCEKFDWTVSFYVFGSIGILWSVLWQFFVYDSPATHPFISLSEQTYIMDAVGDIDNEHIKGHTPWKKILSSMSVYSLIVSSFCNNWGYYALLSVLPTYYSTVHKLDIKSNGLLSAAPYLTIIMVILSASLVSDFMFASGRFSVAFIRKLMTFLGFVGAGSCLLAVGYCDQSLPASIALLIVGISLSGFAWVGWMVNFLDIAPAYAGSLMGMANMAGSIPGFVSTSVLGEFTGAFPIELAWRYFFIVSAAIYYVGSVFYCIFGKGERQPWASDEAVEIDKIEYIIRKSRGSLSAAEVDALRGSIRKRDDEEDEEEDEEGEEEEEKEEGGGDETGGDTANLEEEEVPPEEVV